MPIVHLDKKFIDAKLECPEGKRRIEYVSDDRSGLYVECRSTSPSVGTYYWRTKIDGKTKHFRIGPTNVVSLVDAKKKVIELHSQVLSTGNDPRVDQNTKQEILTFTDFFQDHYLPFAKQHKRTWSRDSELFQLRLKNEFGNIRLNQIGRQQIQSFHTALRESGLAAATANHQVKLLRRALNLAVEWGMLEKNPAALIPLFTEDNKVENYLDQEELENLLTVLRTDRNRPVCHIALFLLSTGARLNEALQATWKQCDRVNQVWRIPASNSKSKKIHSVPLNDAALNVLDQLDTEGRFEYLFINQRTGKPYTTIHKTWDRLRNEAGLPHLRIHDLRHQYASFLVNSGRTLYEVQQ
ncbi:MAG: tyrosine-type recombinase/integrase, partial [Gammaproteobacteria bacterium]|nr:tyrosine-type recombinase/integrase [Gammaproteobacteria bacterium]